MRWSKNMAPTRCGCGSSSWARSRSRPTGTRTACPAPRAISCGCGRWCAASSRPAVRSEIPSVETITRAHKTIQTVTDHIERLRFNTALAALMDQLNYLTKLAPAELGRFALETYVLMLAPMAPAYRRGIVARAGTYHVQSISSHGRSSIPRLASEEMVTVVVQINGKVRDRLLVAAGGSEEADVIAMALGARPSHAISTARRRRRSSTSPTSSSASWPNAPLTREKDPSLRGDPSLTLRMTESEFLVVILNEGCRSEGSTRSDCR